MSLPNNTNVRLTDIVADTVYNQFGNDGMSLLKDLFLNINSFVKYPIQISPNSPADTSVTYQAGIYSLPNGQRLATFKGQTLNSIATGVINFTSGTISTGTVSSFSLPNMVAGNYVRALIQYSATKNAVDVTFGIQDSSLSLAGIPIVKADFDPIAIVELHSTFGGPGDFDAISSSNIIKIISSGAFDPKPLEEDQTVSGVSQSVFNLTSFALPQERSRLAVYRNGLKLKEGVSGDYVVTNDTTVTLNYNAPTNSVLTFRIF